jgi:RNA polymerase sigma factor (sigma-70 family)
MSGRGDPIAAMSNPDPELPDPQLVQRCLSGDETAWRQLVRRYGPLIHAVASRSCTAHDRDDVFQATFLALHRSLPALRDAQSLAKWIITTATREAWRTNRRARAHGAADETLAIEPDRVEALEQSHRVDLALRRLGGRCEELLRFLFREGGGVEYEVVAKELGLQLGSIGPTRRRCLAKLAELLGSDESGSA